jgi:sensor domain CHASE-containing protein
MEYEDNFAFGGINMGSIMCGSLCLVFLLFAVLFAILAFVVWLVVFFKDVHLDSEKAFGKYKIK